MMNTYKNEDLLIAYQKLPLDLQEIILSKNTVSFLQSLCEKYNLSGIKARDLKDEAMFVMLGWIHPKDFIPDLAEKLGVDRETARKIAEEVNQRIFQKVRESLKALHGIEDKPRGQEIGDRGLGNKGQDLGNRNLGDSKTEQKIPPVQTTAPPKPSVAPRPEPQPLEIKPISPLGNIAESAREESIEEKIKPPPSAPQTKFTPREIPPVLEQEIGNRNLGDRRSEQKIHPIQTTVPPKPVPKPEPTMNNSIEIKLDNPIPPQNLPIQEPAAGGKFAPPSQTEIKKDLNIKPQPDIRKNDPYHEQI